MKATLRTIGRSSLGLVAVMLLGCLLGCWNKEEIVYERGHKPGSIQSVAHDDAIWWFVEFEEFFVPTKRRATWDTAPYKRKGGRQWMIRQSLVDGTVESTELTGPAEERISLNPNLSKVFWWKGSWYAHSGESMFRHDTFFVLTDPVGHWAMLKNGARHFGVEDFGMAETYGLKQEIVDGIASSGGGEVLFRSMATSHADFVYRGRKWELKVTAVGSCFQGRLLVDGSPAGSEILFEVCNAGAVISEADYHALPSFLTGLEK